MLLLRYIEVKVLGSNSEVRENQYYRNHRKREKIAQNR